MKIKKYFPWSQRGHKFWNDVLNEEEISLNQILPKLLQLSFNPKASKQLVNLITKEYGLDDKALRLLQVPSSIFLLSPLFFVIIFNYQ